MYMGVCVCECVYMGVCVCMGNMQVNGPGLCEGAGVC